MTRIIHYIRYLLLTLFTKGKALWKSFCKLFQPEETIEDVHEQLIHATKYDPLFENPSTDEGLYVSEHIWNQIQSALPSNYLVPHSKSLQVLLGMRSDAFDQLFAKPTSLPPLFIDAGIWNRISHTLPKSYILPNPDSENITRPMTGTYYDKLFSKLSPTEKEVFVDNKIWEPIKNNIPIDYMLPNPLSDFLFNAMDGHTYHPLISKKTKKEMTDEEIREKILGSLPEDYTFPDRSINRFHRRRKKY